MLLLNKYYLILIILNKYKFKVRDGSTVRAFLLPSFEYVTVMLSGIKVLFYYYFTCSIMQNI